MAEFKEMLKYYRKQAGLTQKELAELINVKPSTISMYEVGQREPDFETEEALADFFNVDLNTLRGKDSERRGARSIPVYDRVAAGAPLEANDNIIDFEDIPEYWPGEYAAVKVKGDSMLPRIQDGDVIIVRIQSDADSGDVVVALVNGEDATVKKLIKQPSGIVLQPFNPAYEPMYFTHEQARDMPVVIWGKVVENRQKF